MTLLEIIQQYSLRQALPVPSLVFGSGDDTYLQLVGLLNEVLDDLSRYQWPQLLREVTFSSAAGEDQGLIETLAPGCLYILNDILFNRSNNTKIFGPLSPQEWQALQAMPSTGPHYQYRLREQKLFIYPAIASGQLIAFEYLGKYAVKAAGAPLPSKRYFSADTDTTIFDPMLLLLGLRWKWKYEKGFRYAEDFRQFETALVQAVAHSTTKKTVKLDGDGAGITSPAILVPLGTWSVP